MYVHLAVWNLSLRRARKLQRRKVYCPHPDHSAAVQVIGPTQALSLTVSKSRDFGTVCKWMMQHVAPTFAESSTT